jgi:flagellar biosynthesis component FlhA
MSIDSDLSNGLITEEIARQGARKFEKRLIFMEPWMEPQSLCRIFKVGIIITVINIVVVLLLEWCKEMKALMLRL